MRLSLLLLLLLAAVAVVAAGKTPPPPVPAAVRQAIAALGDDANSIINYLTQGAGKHHTFNFLAEFVDKFGHRLSGTPDLEMSIDWLVEQLQQAGLDNVHTEDATVPHWERGEEWVQLVSPKVGSHASWPIAMLGLGNSIGTLNSTLADKDGAITADAVVVRTFDELDALGEKVRGKIVVYNQDWVSYGKTVAYRGAGASRAAKYGAVAALIRSVTPFSLNSPHTGAMGPASIPGACITVEAAQMLQRMQDRGERLTVRMKMSARTLPDAKSRNLIAEVTGVEVPHEVVLVSGHLDSWDAPGEQGAMDDAGGAFISLQALLAVKALGLKPKRTLRAVLWTCEEFGGVGADQYHAVHHSESPNFSIVMESDLGTFRPYGLQLTAAPAAVSIVQEIAQLLVPINATQVQADGDGTDIYPFMEDGVPGASLANANDHYFYYHHSSADTMTVLDADDLDLAATVWAVHAYSIACLPALLPRASPAPPALARAN